MKGLALAHLVNDAGTLPTIDHATLDRLEASGAGWVRIAPRLGSRPGWDHQLLTIWAEVADLFRQRRIKTICTLTPEIVAGASQADWDSPDAVRAAAFRARFVAAATAILAALWFVDDWEVWNEPNAWTVPPHAPSQEPTGGSSIAPGHLLALLDDVAPAIRRGRPHAVVILGGLFAHTLHGQRDASSSGAGYLTQIYAAIPPYPLPGGVQHLPPFDAIGYHPYLDQGGALVPGQLAGYLDGLQGVVRRFEGLRAERPVYVTEAGWSTVQVPPALQAANLAALYGALRTRREVQAACWFTLRDVPEARIAFGLLDAAGGPKPAYAAFRAVR